MYKVESGDSLRVLRECSFLAVLVGAVGSVGLTLRAGRHNSSWVLPALFALWVLSPFAALILAGVISKGWPALIRATVYCLAILLTLVSLGVYAEVAFGPPRAKTAAAFVVLPPASWLLIAAVISIAALLSKKRP
jgi:hypothetical protein